MENRIHTYSLVVERQEEGGFRAYFPALPGCGAEGISYEGTIKSAEEALAHYVRDTSNKNTVFPEEEMHESMSLSVTVVA